MKKREVVTFSLVDESKEPDLLPTNIVALEVVTWKGKQDHQQILAIASNTTTIQVTPHEAIELLEEQFKKPFPSCPETHSDILDLAEMIQGVAGRKKIARLVHLQCLLGDIKKHLMEHSFSGHRQNALCAILQVFGSFLEGFEFVNPVQASGVLGLVLENQEQWKSQFARLEELQKEREQGQERNEKEN